MLDKNDLKKIEQIAENATKRVIKGAFSEFYEVIFAPYVERNEKEHKQIIDILKRHEHQL